MAIPMAGEHGSSGMNRIDRKDLPALFTGLMATLAGIGLARFAYTPLLPAIIQQGWFGSAQAVYLGAANLLGYLLGALAAHHLTERFPARWGLAASFVGIGLSFVLCASPGSFSSFFLCRLVSGIAGAILMVVGPSLALTATPAARQTTVGALVFTGIGLGALLSATAVPLLLELDLNWTWRALGGLTLLAGMICDRAAACLPKRQAPTVSDGSRASAPAGPVLLLVVAAYALDAVGFVPHSLF